MSERLPSGVRIDAPVPEDARRILSHDALAFVADLQRELGTRRAELLEYRAERRASLAAGHDGKREGDHAGENGDGQHDCEVREADLVGQEVVP